MGLLKVNRSHSPCLAHGVSILFSDRMPSSLEQPHVIDLVAHDPATDEVALVMSETRPWSGTASNFSSFRRKVNAYLSFALDGEMAENYPALAEKPIRLQLNCATEPDLRTARLIRLISEQIAFQGIKFVVRIKAPPEPR